MATLEKEERKTAPNIYVYLMCQDDPKKCTARKLSRFRLATPVHHPRGIPRRALILNPSVKEVLVSADASSMQKLVAIDCSWRRADRVFARRFRGVNKRLPILLAANPVNFGHRSVLSSVEALAAALCIGGFWEESRKLLSLFKWGPTFLDLNQDPLKDYGAAMSVDETLRIEAEYFPNGSSH